MGHVTIKDGKIASKNGQLISDLSPGFRAFAERHDGVQFVDLTPEQDACDIQALSWDGSKVVINAAKDAEIKEVERENDAIRRSCTAEEFMRAYLLERAGDGTRMAEIAQKVATELTR